MSEPWPPSVIRHQGNTPPRAAANASQAPPAGQHHREGERGHGDDPEALTAVRWWRAGPVRRPGSARQGLVADRGEHLARVVVRQLSAGEKDVGRGDLVRAGGPPRRHLAAEQAHFFLPRDSHVPAADRCRSAGPGRSGSGQAFRGQAGQDGLPYCAVGCGQNVFVKDSRVVQIEGDPDSPMSRGRLSRKESASLQLAKEGSHQYIGEVPSPVRHRMGATRPGYGDGHDRRPGAWRPPSRLAARGG